MKRLFPENVDNYAVINTAELIEAVRRVSLVLEREAALRFTFTIDGVTLEAIGSEQAQASETIDAHLNGNDTVVSSSPHSYWMVSALCTLNSCGSRSLRPKTRTSLVPCLSPANLRRTSPARIITNISYSRICYFGNLRPTFTGIPRKK